MPIIPDGPAMTPAERRKLRGTHKEVAKGYFAKPGTGPAGETCGSCAHSFRVKTYRKAFWKCLRMQHQWTGGRATDILVGAPACSGWELEPALADEPRRPAEPDDLAARFREIAGDCAKCAVRDANCCVLAECPFLTICPVRPAEAP